MKNSKLIKARCPKGFHLVVQESFNGLSGERIFVFENSQKQKLYAKLCSESDLLKGFVWNILSPSELKALNIEESVPNKEAYEGKGYVVEESIGENLWNPESGESLEDYKKRMQGKLVKGEITKTQLDDILKQNPQVNIYLGSQGEGEPTGEDLRSENEDLKNKLSIIAQQEFERKKRRLGAPSQITSPEKLREWEEEQNANRDADPTRRRSSGSLGLESNISGGSHGYEDYPSMINDLQRRKRSKNATEREEATEILNESMRKAIAGKKQKDFETDIEGGEEATIEGFKKEYRKRKEGVD